MTIAPATVPVQFVPQTGTFTLDTFTDPTGNPVEVIDIDDGVALAGKASLPSGLSGTMHVQLIALNANNAVLSSKAFKINGGPEGPNVDYPWDLPAGPLTALTEGLPYELVLTMTFTNDAGQHEDIGAIYSLGTFLVV